MANISKIEVDGVTYDIEDTVARNNSGGSGLTGDIKQALLACFQKVAYIDENGQDYYDALEAALYPPANLSYITAVYTQGSTVIYNTDSLNSLKTDLVVTAHYDDSSSETVSSYTLSGTLSVGTSTITVSYGGKTTEFTVVVSERAAIYNWDFKTSLTDSVAGITAGLGGTTPPVRDSNGLTISNTASGVFFKTAKFNVNQTMEIDVGDMTYTGSARGRFVMVDTNNNILQNATDGLIYDSGKWKVYKSSWVVGSNSDPIVFKNKTLIIKQYLSNETYHTDFYADDTLVMAYTNSTAPLFNNSYFQIGATANGINGVVIEGVRVYGGV